MYMYMGGSKMGFGHVRIEKAYSDHFGANFEVLWFCY